MIYLLGQFDVPESRLGEDLLRGAVELSEETTKAWDANWFELIDPNNEIWGSLCKFGLTIAAFSLIFVSLKMAAENVQGRWFFSELGEFIVWPLVIILFLGGNGSLLSQTVLLIRHIGHQQVVKVLEAELADLTVRRALEDVTLTSSAREQIAAIFAECQGEGPAEYSDCMEEKRPIVEEIIAQAEEIHGGPLEALTAWSEDMFQPSNNPFTAFLPSSIIKAFLYGLQWGFVNILEAALLMTATLAPVAVGLSLLPLGSRALWAWGSGFVGLFGIQLGYNILVGTAATVVVSTGGQNLNDWGFLTIISIFAPALAVLLGGGGGIALYQGLNSNMSKIAQFAFNATAGAATSLIKVFVP
jgi:hypothetical protein